METVFLIVLRSRPRPRQVWQGVVITSPSPLQVGQVVTWTIEPRKVWRTWRTSPRPPQVAQRWGVVPGSAPVPRQVEQTSSRVISISFSTPKTDFFEGEDDRVVQIGAAARGIAPAAAPTARPHPKAEELFEDIGEIDRW